MDITPLIDESKKIIHGYGSGFFVINGEEIKGHIAISATEVFPHKIESFEQLSLENILEATQQLSEVDLLLIGVGNKHKMLPPQLTMALKKNNIQSESMTTAAACRTYNVLLSESRNVGAILFCSD
jgi:uncharacterized protein